MQDTNPTPMLDLDDTRDALTWVENAYVIPPVPGNRGRENPSGVLDEKQNFVPQSQSWVSPDRTVNSAPTLISGDMPTLRGRYIFGGIFYGHFGHFIVESLARLWAQDAVEGPIDGMIFTPKNPGFPEKSVLQLQGRAQALGLQVPLLVANEPTRVEYLCVPKQGFGMGELAGGSAAFRAFVNDHAGEDIPAKGNEKLYISRSDLPPFRGSILGEKRLENYLSAEGFDIFHPQRHSIDAQIARYKAAKLIISTDCSPLHLVGYVGHSEQRVVIVTRRSMEISDYLAQQLRVFKGIEVTIANCLVNDWMPQPGRRPSRTSFGEVDLAALQAHFLEYGFEEDTTPWETLNEADIQADLDRISATHETTFLPFK